MLQKDSLELPRFPINEQYGDLKRFKTLTKTLPFKYKKILPAEKYLQKNLNPPEVKIEFYNDIKNLKNISCYSNELNTWKKSETFFVNNHTLAVKLRGKFVGEREELTVHFKKIKVIGDG